MRKGSKQPETLSVPLELWRLQLGVVSPNLPRFVSKTKHKVLANLMEQPIADLFAYTQQTKFK